MFLLLNRKFMWFMVIWFAFLQTISPFIHGHIGADSPSQGYGLHMHVLEVQHDGVHVLKNAHSVHTIGVDEALVKSADLLPAPFFIVLFVLCLFVSVTQTFNFNYIFPTRLSLYLRPQSKPRAPPNL
jgi:hypothetical protein